MNKFELAKNIANSTTLSRWDHATVSAALIRRFPDALQNLAPKISHELIDALPAKYAPTVAAVTTQLFKIETFNRVFKHCRQHNVFPTPDFTHPEMAPTAAFADLELPDLATIDRFAEWLTLPIDRLEYLADPSSRHEEHGETSVNHYHYKIIKKKRGGTRLLEAPKQKLKAMQRRILKEIVGKIPSNPSAYGFVKGHNCLGAASKHSGEEVVICFDLKAYFPSINAGRVYGLFRCMGYPHVVARYLTALCTTATPNHILERMSFEDRTLYKSAHLPQGSPVSPALANHLTYSLDCRLSALSSRVEATYTRYADDLTFSGNRNIVGLILRAVPEIVHNEGFKINRSKTRVMRQSSRQLVTGIVVNQHLNVSRKHFDQLKATIHSCGKPDDHRLGNPEFRASLLGKINWVETVNPKRGQKLRTALAHVLANRQAS